jgi:hypothetical protein
VRFLGLPDEFAPPDRAAAEIAAMPGLLDRLKYFERIPAGAWRDWIAHEARIAIALRIVDGGMPIGDRRAAIEQVPEIWRDQVRAYVLSFWETRHIRAKHRQKLAAQREARAA